MKNTEIRIIEELRKGSRTLTELALAIDKSPSRTSELVGAMEGAGLVITELRKGKKIANLARSSRLAFLLKLMDRYPLKKLLSGKKETILLALLEPKTTRELELATGLSSSEIYKDIRELKEVGALKKNKKYQIAIPDLLMYMRLTEEEAKIRETLPYEIVLFSDDIKIKKVPAGEPAGGTLTAFSRFPEFGVDFFPISTYYCAPAKRLDLEEIFVHSILASENKKQMTMVCILYLKNRRLLDTEKIDSFAKKYRVREKWLDVLAFLDGRKVLNKELFLPFDEFMQKARVYKVKVYPKYPEEKLLEVFEHIATCLRKKLNIFLIGGGNLILKRLKDTTKDLDIVLKNRKDLILLRNCLQSLGYKKCLSVEKAYQRLEASEIFEKAGNPRFDIFVQRICNALILSKNIIGRSTLFRNYGLLNVYLVSLEDVFLFKSITEREGDLEDVRAIAGQEIDWSKIFQEILKQEKLTKRFFSFSVLDTLDILKERYEIESPVHKRLISHCLELAILLALKKSKTITELRKELEFPGYQILNKLRKLEREGKVRVSRKGKINIYSKP